jgi:raffinose/stachyose/melibiose transport system permease protein
VGYAAVLTNGNFPGYFLNSLIVTDASLFFVLLFGAMAAFALSEYRFRGNTLMGPLPRARHHDPIRLGHRRDPRADGGRRAREHADRR